MEFADHCVNRAHLGVWSLGCQCLSLVSGGPLAVGKPSGGIGSCVAHHPAGEPIFNYVVHRDFKSRKEQAPKNFLKSFLP